MPCRIPGNIECIHCYFEHNNLFYLVLSAARRVAPGDLAVVWPPVRVPADGEDVLREDEPGREGQRVRRRRRVQPQQRQQRRQQQHRRRPHLVKRCTYDNGVYRTTKREMKR